MSEELKVNKKPESKIRLDLFKGIMHSLSRFEFVKGDDEVLIFWDNDIEQDRYISRNLTMPELITWIVRIHESESLARGQRKAKAEIRAALGIQ